MPQNYTIRLREDEYEKLQNGVTVTVCIASSNPNEKYRDIDIQPPR